MTDPDMTPEAVEALIERLRVAYGGELSRDCAATLRALSAALGNAVAEAHATGAERARWKARAESADAKLKEAVNRMEEIAHMGYDMPSTFAGTEGEWYSRRANLMQGIARAFIATLDQST